MSSQMSFPLTYRDDGAGPGAPSAPQAAAAVVTHREATDSDDPMANHPVDEELLSKLGRALADRLNALVDALDQQR